MLCAIWQHSHNLKNMKNTFGGCYFLVKLLALACYFTKRNILHECFSSFLNCENGSK